MDQSFKPKIFYNTRQTWRTTWIVGIGILVLKHAVRFHFFYSYYYFFAIGLIPLAYSFCRYATIDPSGITLYYGIFFQRNQIRLPWNQIKSAGMSVYDQSHISTVGGRVHFTVKETVQKKAVLLKILMPFSEKERNELMDRINKNIVKDEIVINETGSEILLTRPPEGGFKRFLFSMDPFVQVHDADLSGNHFATIYSLIVVLNAVIFICAILLGVTV